MYKKISQKSVKRQHNIKPSVDPNPKRNLMSFGNHFSYTNDYIVRYTSIVMIVLK